MEVNPSEEHTTRWNGYNGKRPMKRSVNGDVCPLPIQRPRSPMYRQPFNPRWIPRPHQSSQQSWSPNMIRPMRPPMAPRIPRPMFAPMGRPFTPRPGQPIVRPFDSPNRMPFQPNFRPNFRGQSPPIDPSLARPDMCSGVMPGVMMSPPFNTGQHIPRPQDNEMPQRLTLEVNGNEIVINGQSYRAKNSEWNEYDIKQLLYKLFAEVIDLNPLIDLNYESLRIGRPSAVSALYTGKQCASCSLRFRDSDKYSQHLDWHFRQNRRAKERSDRKTDSSRAHLPSRQWYYPMDQWFQFNEVIDGDNSSGQPYHVTNSLKNERISSVDVQRDEVLNSCPVCNERFDQKWSHDDEEWQLQNAVKHSDRKIYHPLCLKDFESNQTIRAIGVTNGMTDSYEDWNLKGH